MRFSQIPLERQIFCNRTLNMRSIKAIGYDMDYTLILYNSREWEQRAYNHLKNQFLKEGWPVEKLEFDPSFICRGLVVDIDKGNLLKINRFGFVKKASHGTSLIEYEQQRQEYSRIIVDLSGRRWVFLNTLFSLSEGCMYAQLVDLLDQRKIPLIMGYAELYSKVRQMIDEAHMEGQLKSDIISNPSKYVIQDPESVLALLDQHYAGKKLMLITNSEWEYSQSMMTYAFDPFLPKGMKWRDLFDVVIVGARKPAFFTTDNQFFEVMPESGLMRPDHMLKGLRSKAVYLGGSARQLEKLLGLSGDEILYVGDHMFGDVQVTKDILRWRTALVLSELEDEIKDNLAFRENEKKIEVLMVEKEELEGEMASLRVLIQRFKEGYGPDSKEKIEEIQAKLDAVKAKHQGLDQSIAPLARRSSELGNPMWGGLMRAGNDKSKLAYRVERYADIYTSRVSNFLYATPFVYLRSPRGILPHDL